VVGVPVMVPAVPVMVPAVPVMVPAVAVRMDRPTGRPLADQEAMVADGDESVAALSRAVMAMPVGLDWGPGLVTLTVLAPAGLVMAQVKLAGPLRPEASVAVTLTV